MDLVIAWFLADIFTGFVHWIQDRYLVLGSRFEFLNKTVIANELHHTAPQEFLKYTLWKNMDSSAIIAWPLCMILIMIGAPKIIWMTIFFASFGNVVHRWAHTSTPKLNPIIKGMQFSGVFITGTHHLKHHYDQNGLVMRQNTRHKYCAMTNYMNPILDGLKIFVILEFLLRIIGIHAIKRTKR